MSMQKRDDGAFLTIEEIKQVLDWWWGNYSGGAKLYKKLKRRIRKAEGGGR